MKKSTEKCTALHSLGRALQGKDIKSSPKEEPIRKPMKTTGAVNSGLSSNNITATLR